MSSSRGRPTTPPSAAGQSVWRDGSSITEQHGLIRHKLKGEKEPLLKEVLRGLDLHHPSCAELNANAMF